VAYDCWLPKTRQLLRIFSGPQPLSFDTLTTLENTDYFLSDTREPAGVRYPTAPCLLTTARLSSACGISNTVFTLAPLSFSPTTTSSQRRRRSSAAYIPPALNLQEASPLEDNFGATSGLPALDFAQPLPPIPGTPHDGMSLSRSPSPRRGGGWSSPGLNTPGASGRSSPRKGYGDLHMNGGINSVTWASAKAKSDEVNGYPAFSLRHNGFFARHARRISGSLPRFNLGTRRDYADKEKLGRGRWSPSNGTRAGRLRTFAASFLRRTRLRFLLVLAFVVAVILFYVTRKFVQYAVWPQELI